MAIKGTIELEDTILVFEYKTEKWEPGSPEVQPCEPFIDLLVIDQLSGKSQRVEINPDLFSVSMALSLAQSGEPKGVDLDEVYPDLEDFMVNVELPLELRWIP